MTKRLVRVKAKIKAAGVRFEIPGLDELAPRMHAVLEAIYGAYVLRERAGPDDPSGTALAEEALYLARLVTELLPERAEALGLYALLLLCEARRPARLDDRGVFIPLDRQDVSRWDRAAIAQANTLLGRAASLHDHGPFQIEAAIQAAHCHTIYGHPTPWADIAVLYERLIALSPTIGARLGQAIAVAHAEHDPSAGLVLVDTLASPQLQAHQPWWAARGYLLALAGRNAQSVESYERARDLCTDEAVRGSIEDRLEILRGALH
jgi:RNA polymerase sigma-70 factor (ECF subfamily)